jgi:hypothetical protein
MDSSLEKSTSPNSYQSYYVNMFNQFSPTSFINSSLDSTSSSLNNSNSSSFYYGTSSPTTNNYMPSQQNYYAASSYLPYATNYSSSIVATIPPSYLSSDSMYSSTNYQPDGSSSFMLATPPIECYEKQMPSTTSAGYKKRKREMAENADVENDEPTQKQAQREKRPRVYKLVDAAKIYPSNCMLCNMEFDSVAKCLLHTSRVHNRRKGNECPLCCKK